MDFKTGYCVATLGMVSHSSVALCQTILPMKVRTAMLGSTQVFGIIINMLGKSSEPHPDVKAMLSFDERMSPQWISDQRGLSSFSVKVHSEMVKLEVYPQVTTLIHLKSRYWSWRTCWG